jgi:hypothetical protein
LVGIAKKMLLGVVFKNYNDSVIINDHCLLYFLNIRVGLVTEIEEAIKETGP